MLAGSESKATRWILGGMVAAGVGRAMSNGEDASVFPGVLLILAGLGLSIWGCTLYARGKGQDSWFGLFGILGLIGLIVLVFIEDKYKCCKQGGENCTHGREKKKDWSSKAA
jgi:hypothetical protein